MYTLLDNFGQVSIANHLKNGYHLCISEHKEDLEVIKRILGDDSLRIEQCIVCPCCHKEITDYVNVHSIDSIDIEHFKATGEFTSTIVDICDDCFSDLEKYIPSYDCILNYELTEHRQCFKWLKDNNKFYQFANTKAQSDYFMLDIPQKAKGHYTFSFDYELSAENKEQLERALDTIFNYFYDNQEKELESNFGYDLKCKAINYRLDIKNAEVDLGLTECPQDLGD